MPQPKLLLVDGHSLAYRAFYAIQRLSNSKGQPTNAIFGFARIVRKLIQEQSPTHGAVALDLGEPVARLAKLESYKAHRKPMPEDLRSQIPLIREFLSCSRIAVIEKEGVEADDIIATLASQARVASFTVAIATSDKDFMQIVDDSIVLLNPASKEGASVDAAAVKTRYGVTPSQMVDFLSLQGDSVDNIPGVPGVGAKTAATLLQNFESLDRLYDRLGEVADAKLRQKLEEHRPRVELNRQLVRLETAVPLDIQPGQLGLGPPAFAPLIAFFERLEFRSLTEEVRRDASQAGNPELSLGL